MLFLQQNHASPLLSDYLIQLEVVTECLHVKKEIPSLNVIYREEEDDS